MYVWVILLLQNILKNKKGPPPNYFEEALCFYGILE